MKDSCEVCGVAPAINTAGHTVLCDYHFDQLASAVSPPNQVPSNVGQGTITSYPRLERHQEGWLVSCDLDWSHSPCAWGARSDSRDGVIELMALHALEHTKQSGHNVILDFRTPEEREAEDDRLQADLLAMKARLDDH